MIAVKKILLKISLISILTVFNCTLTPAIEPGWIEGSIRDTQDSPLEGANVILVETLEDGSEITTVRTDPDGYYKVTPKQSGEKEIFIWAVGFAPKRIKIQVDDKNQIINETLSPAAIIDGKVLESFNKPIKGSQAKVEFLDTPSFSLLPNLCNCDVETDDEGNFRFRSVERARTFRIIVSHPEYDSYISPEINLDSDEVLTQNIILTLKSEQDAAKNRTP